MEFYIQWCGALHWTHWRSYLKQLICSYLASWFSEKATKVGSPPTFPKLITQLWGIPQPQYFVTSLLEPHWTRHYIYHKEDTKVGSQTLATKFGFVPDCLGSNWHLNKHWFRQWLGAKQATSHYVNQWWSSSLMHSFIIIPQWFNTMRLRQRSRIFLTTFTNFYAFSWMKTYEFRLKIHRSLFLRVQLTIAQHLFR